MNPIIKEQLSKCQIAQIPSFSENDLSLIIPKTGEKNHLDLTEGYTYLIELEDYILHPFPNFNLHTTWNHGVIPTSMFLRATILKINGNMIQVDGYGSDVNGDSVKEHYPNYWLPRKSITIRKLLR